MRDREEFEKLPEIREIMNSHGIYFMNHSGFYEAAEFKDFECEQYVNGAWYAWQARVPEGYAVVPKEPSAKTLEAGSNASGDGKMGFATHMDVNNSYKAMIESE